MKLQAFNCPNCKAPLSLPSGSQDRRFIFCQYCGTKIMIDDIEFYKEDSKTERSRIRAGRDIDIEEKRLEYKNKRQESKMDFVLLIAMMIFDAFMFYVAFKLI